MELLIPGLAFLLFGIAIAFLVVPKIAPAMLITGAGVAIALAAYMHYVKFGNEEYNRSTWQNNLKTYARWVIFGAVLFGAYAFYAMNAGSGVSSGFTTVSIPKIGGGLDDVVNRISSRIEDLFRKGRLSLD